MKLPKAAGGLLKACAISAAFLLSHAAGAATLEGASISHNTSPAHTTPDALLTVTGFAVSNATVTANLGQSGAWFGVVGGNASAIDGTECVTFQFAPGAALHGIGHVWTRSRIIISGFVADPGFSDPSGFANGVSYSNGTLTYYCPWDSGVEHAFSFSNPAASMGRTLRLNVHDSSSGWQATVTRINYTPFPDSAAANIGSPQQTMDHFSASDAWSMQNVGLWSLTNKTIVADLLFNTNSGIGLSAWRFNLPAGFDPTIQAGNLWQRWRTANGFLVGSNSYDWSRQPGQRWFLSAAKARGIDQYIAMVYSPPTNYTRNGYGYCTDGAGSSNLKPGYEAAFAQSMAEVLAYFKTNPAPAERIDFDYLMPVNEPAWEWNNNSQEGSRHSNQDIIAVAQALNSALVSRGLNTKIVLSEAGDLPSLYQNQSSIGNKYGETYGNYLSSFNSITNFISRNISAHSYWTDNPATQLVQVRQTLKSKLDAQPFWRYWQTEYCILGTAGPGRDLTMDTALKVSRVIWADLAIANASAWHWWLSLSQADYKDGLLYTDFWQPGDPETIFCSKNFWAFGQWARFIRPGWRRVEMSSHTKVYDTMGAAFVSPSTNSVVVVMINASSTNKLISPDATGLGAGTGIVCWSPWITSAAPSDNLAPLPPVPPGGACTVPAGSVVTFVGTVAASNSPPPALLQPIADRKAAPGQLLQIMASVTNSTIPASLLSMRVYSDNPVLVSSTNITISSPPATGGISREVFENLAGSQIANLAAAPFFPHAPDATGERGIFEAPQSAGGAQGTRMRGFLVPPQAGEYTFWISSRGASQLYLSTDDNPANKTLIAAVTNYTAAREWTKEPGQQSSPVTLAANRRYYVETVHVSADDSGHLAVGWQLPDSTLERPIPGPRLEPWSDPLSTSAERVLALQFSTNQTGTVGISVVVTDTIGRAFTNFFNVTVVTNYVRPTAHVSGDAALCGDDESSIIKASLTGAGPWTLTWSDGFEQTTNQSPAIRSVSPGYTTTYTLAGLYDVSGPAIAADLTGSATVARVQSPIKWTGLSTDWTANILGTWKDANAANVTYCPNLPVIFDEDALGPSPLSVDLGATVSPASITCANTLRDYIISGSGTLGGSGASLEKAGAGTLVLAVNCTFGGGIRASQGTLQIGNGGAAGNIPNFTPVHIDGAVAFNRQGNVTWIPPRGGITGSGLLVQNGPGKLGIAGESVFGLAGTFPDVSILVGPGATLDTVRFNPAGRITLDAGVLWSSGGSSPTYRSWVLTRGVKIRSNTASSTIGTSGANSDIHLLAATQFDIENGAADDDLSVPARLANAPPEYGSSPGGIVKTGPGRMVLAGANTYTGDTIVSNGVLVIDGVVNGPVIVYAGGMLSGTGTINANVTVQPSGSFSPGNNVGRITINGGLTLSGATIMELNKSIAGSNDFVAISGPLGLGGSLMVTNSGPALSAGDTFRLFSIPGASGFAQTILPPLAPGLGWTNALSADGTIKVVRQYSTEPAALKAEVSSGLLTLQWTEDHIGWLLQARTNFNPSILDGIWWDMPGSDGTNIWSNPIDPMNPPVFYRLRMP